MGVVYKLRNEIKDYIVRQKESNPRFGCRALTALVNDTFHISLSKSHVNSVIKQEGLSNRVGRPAIARKGLYQGTGIGSYLFRAADALLGGSVRIADLLRKILPQEIDATLLTEAGIYGCLFPDYERANSGFWRCISVEGASRKLIISYLKEMKGVTIPINDLRSILDGIKQEVRGITFTFSNGVSGVVDGQMKTLWTSLEKVPYDFSTPFFTFNRIMDAASNAARPLVLFSCPGYDTAPASWIDLLRSISEGVSLERAVAHDGKGNSLRTIVDSRIFDFGMIAALWPWQYLSSCTVREENESTEWYFRAMKKRFFLREATVSLKQKATNSLYNIRAVVVRMDKDSKPIATLICTKSREEINTISLASHYIEKCPNIIDGYKDFSRKIELFTYNQSSRRSFTDDCFISPSGENTLKDLFECHVRTVDAYVRRYFLPPNYKEVDLAATIAHFYGVRGKLRKYRQHTVCTFLPDRRSPCRSDLFYAVQKLNEREIGSADGSRLWFTVK